MRDDLQQAADLRLEFPFLACHDLIPYQHAPTRTPRDM
jgi:hypothetical protein